jgi:hypothetical protein
MRLTCVEQDVDVVHLIRLYPVSQLRYAAIGNLVGIYYRTRGL